MFAGSNIAQPIIASPRKSFSKWVLENTVNPAPQKITETAEKESSGKATQNDSSTLNMGIGAKKYAPKPALNTTSLNSGSSWKNNDTATNKTSVGQNSYRGFAVKIVGDDTTEKDYDDFYAGFRSESEDPKNKTPNTYRPTYSYDITTQKGVDEKSDDAVLLGSMKIIHISTKRKAKRKLSRKNALIFHMIWKMKQAPI